MNNMFIPKGALAVVDDDEAKQRRIEIREKLLRGEEVKVTPEGNVKDSNKSKNEEGIVVPRGKLASFYWYENDPDLLRSEKIGMNKFFPQFKLDKLNDGRLYWTGKLVTDLRKGGVWYLQAIYEHNHPNNSSYGGSVKIYSIEPDLDKIRKKLGHIPHLLIDTKGEVYLCTARIEDVRDGVHAVTSAASSLAWAAKWIAAFELWMAGDIKTSQFGSHDI